MGVFHDTANPPAELGYDPRDWAVDVLLNPSRATLRDWRDGGTDYAEGQQQVIGYNRIIIENTSDDAERAAAQQRIDEIEAERVERRAKLGRALHAFYGTTPAGRWDFSSPEAALATIERDDIPEEVITWVLLLPHAVSQRRQDLIVKKLHASFETTED
jgi:hypothetical protein